MEGKSVSLTEGPKLDRAQDICHNVRSNMRVLCILLLMSFAGALAAEVARPLNFIRAIVNETIITEGQVVDAARPFIDPLLQTERDADAFKAKVSQVLSETLSNLVENQLILDDFKTGGAHLPDAYVEDEIKDRMRQRGQTRSALTKELHEQDTTYETFRDQVRNRIILDVMRHRNVGSAIMISPQKIERYYATNLTKFQLGNQIKLRMIVLNCSAGNSIEEVKKRAQEISTKIDEGAAFAEMATIYSEGSQNREGGDLEWREESKLSKGFTDVAAGLKPGQQSGVLGYATETNGVFWMYQYNKAGQPTIGRKYTEKNELLEEKKFDEAITDTTLPATPQDFRLVLLEDRRVARTESLTEVRERIEKDLIVQERERLRKKWVERLKAKAFVRTFQ